MNNLHKIIASLLFPLILITGCSFENEGSTTEEIVYQEETMTGIVHTIAPIDQVIIGAVKLIKVDNSDIILVSDTIDLESDEYVGNKVKVMGYYDDTITTMFHVNAIEQLEFLRVKEVQKIPYINESLNIGMTIYDDFEIITDTTSAQFVEMNDQEEELYNIKITQYAVAPTEDVYSFLNLEKDNLSDNYKSVRVGNDFIAAINKNNNSNKTHNFWFKINNKIINLTFNNSHEDHLLASENVFYEILSTVRSLDPINVDMDPSAVVNVTTEVIDSIESVPSPDFKGEEAMDIIDDTSTNNNVEEVIINLDNYRNFESMPFKFKTVYPKNWYYTAQKTTDAIHRYIFTDSPIEDSLNTKALITLEVKQMTTKEFESLEAINIDSNANIIKQLHDENIKIYVIQRNESSVFYIYGQNEFLEYMIDMAKSLTNL